MSTHMHKGHRQRMKARFMENGFNGFSEHEIMELLLYYCLPRGDINELAHTLVDYFGSVLQVLEAPRGELEKIPGIGPSVITYLTLLRETHRHLNISRGKIKDVLLTMEDFGKYLQEYFFGSINETVYLLCLDAKGMVINCYKICEGSVTSANLPFRKVIDTAIRSNAATVVLAHNHPGGLALPSAEDVLVTNRLAKALYMADVVLLDHIIVAESDYISLYFSQMYDYRTAVSEE